MANPYISLVTAAFNAESTVADTLASVRHAKTPSTEYIFVDGGSTDNTSDCVRKYRDIIDLSICEPDDGQYHAIAKGIARSTGQILGWINADDIIMPWTLRVVEMVFKQFPEVNWITGMPTFLDRFGNVVKLHTKPASYPRRLVANGWFDRSHGGFLQQESMFWRRSLYDRVGGLDLTLSLAADYALWTSFARHADLIPIDIPLAAFRELPGEQRSSAGAGLYDDEVNRVKAALGTEGRIWRSLASRGRAMGALARLAISGSGPLITYDRASRHWKLISRRRSISRQHLSSLLDLKLAETL